MRLLAQGFGGYMFGDPYIDGSARSEEESY